MTTTSDDRRERAVQAALETYRRSVRATIERGFHDAYDEALIRTTLAAYDAASNDLPHSVDEAERIFDAAYTEAKGRIVEARASWGPLIETGGTAE